jgi:hypothetical protein
MACHVQGVPDDLLVVPAGWEFRFPWSARTVPVAAAPRIAVQDVRDTFRKKAY